MIVILALFFFFILGSSLLINSKKIKSEVKTVRKYKIIFIVSLCLLLLPLFNITSFTITASEPLSSTTSSSQRPQIIKEKTGFPLTFVTTIKQQGDSGGEVTYDSTNFLFNQLIYISFCVALGFFVTSRLSGSK